MSTSAYASTTCHACVHSINTATSCEGLGFSSMRDTRMQALLKTLLQKIWEDIAY